MIIKDERLTVRMTKDLKRKIVREARKQGLSAANYVAKEMEQALKADKGAKRS